MFNFPTAITSKTAIVLILVVTSIIVLDSSIVKFVAYSNQELPTPAYVSIFVAFSIVYVGIVYVVLRSVNIKQSISGLHFGMAVKWYYLIISFTQYSLIAILVIVILQIVLFKGYSIILLFSAIYISHIVAMLFLFLLVLLLWDWLKTRKNKILSLYAISLTLMAMTIMTSLVYGTFTLYGHSLSIKQYPIHVFLYSLPRSELGSTFGTLLDVTSLLSFVLFWIASAMLLSTYRTKMGKIKYWIVISIPLIYFLFPFETYVPRIFEPVAFSMFLSGVIKVSVFSATKQIGAFFFGLTFWIAATLVSKTEVRTYLLISAIGMAMIFGSIEIDSLLYAVYPPFGLVTILFMPLGAYMLFTGIFLSATFVARDKELRREFYKTAYSQLDLLRSIGVTQMENELLKVHKSAERRKSSLQIKEPHVEKDNVREALDEILNDMDRDNVREILHDVLTDVYSKTRPKSEKS